MKKVVGLLTVLLTLTGFSSCEPTPGMAEPSTYLCSIIDESTLECQHTYDRNTKKKYTIIEAIGFVCTPASGFAEIKTHHEVLHKELNRCKEK